MFFPACRYLGKRLLGKLALKPKGSPPLLGDGLGIHTAGDHSIHVRGAVQPLPTAWSHCRWPHFCLKSVLWIPPVKEDDSKVHGTRSDGFCKNEIYARSTWESFWKLFVFFYGFFFFIFFLICWDFFFSWGDEVSLPSSWSPGANSVIPRTETCPTSHFSLVQHALAFFHSSFL